MKEKNENQKFYIKNIDFGKPISLKELIDYVDNGVKSRTIVQRNNFSMTFISFDKGEIISKYSMPMDAIITAIDGECEIIIDEQKKFILKDGETIVVPSNVLHSIDAIEQLKIMIITYNE